MTFFDIFVQVLQLTFFLVTFSIITHYIIHTGSSRVSRKHLAKTFTSSNTLTFNILLQLNLQLYPIRTWHAFLQTCKTITP